MNFLDAGNLPGWRAALCLFISACASIPTTPDSPRIVSLREDFITFSKETKPSVSSSFFWEHQRLFEQVVYREIVKNPGRVQERKLRLIDYLSRDPSNATRVIGAFSSLENTAQNHISKFRESFPDANYGYTIYFVPSFLWFSGRAGFFDEKSAYVAFGADNIAKNNEDISILFSHEMFHALHYKTLGLTKERLKIYESDPLASLWFEGFASYESAVINGLQAEPESVFGKLGKDCAKRKSALAKAFLIEVDAHPVFNEALLDKWFGSGDAEKGIPPMAAYCLGMLVLSDLASSDSVKILLRWDPLMKKVEIIGAISRIAGKTSR